jgi:8-oxo-dGTP pyrophosphatase MutT (NUDIX family)
MTGAGSKWRTLSSRSIYRNPWFSVREDEVLRPDGTPGIYGVVEMPSYAGVVAIRSDGKIAMIRQWRYLTGRSSLEVPAGSTSSRDADILSTARRELLEEAGVEAQSWTPLGRVDYSAVSNPGFLFLATGLTEAARPDNLDDWTAPIWLPYVDVLGLVMDGKITESTSVAAVLMAEAQRSASRWSLEALLDADLN